MVSLLHLPPELLDQIVSVLAEEKPLSAKFLHEEPSNSLLRSPYHPLKDLSQACRTTRGLCFPSLFSAVKVDLNNTGGFFKFARTHHLSTHANSLVLYFDSNNQTDEISGYDIWLTITQIIDSVKPSVMTAVFAPPLFAKIVPYELNFNDQWAFSIPLQVLQLKMPRHLARSSQVPQKAKKSQNVFQLRKWTHCTFNEGSSIKGYSSYEYFLKKAPSIFAPRHRHLFDEKLTDGSFENLAYFDYIAMFPINDIDRLCWCIDRMKNLKCLRVQFAPFLNNNVLDDPSVLGKCQTKDLWQEFEACYHALGFHIEITRHEGTSSLEKFISLDYANPNLRKTIDRQLRYPNWAFQPDGSNGSWYFTKESVNTWSGRSASS